MLASPASVELASTPSLGRRSRRRSVAQPSVLLLAAILLLAGVVRFWGLGSEPVLYFDSGVYLGEGAFLRSAAERATAAVVAPGPPGVLERVAQATANGTDAHAPDIAKPAHAILLGISMLLLGKTVLAGALVSALAGLGTVIVTYALGVRGWGQRVGLLAALLLAVSGQHLVYSREPLVESDGMFFAALAALIYLQARTWRVPVASPGTPRVPWRGLVLAGIVFGVAFACNQRLSYLPAVLFVAELAHWSGVRQLIRRGVLIGLGLLAPLAVIELAYLGARWLGRTAGVPTTFLDYVQQMAAFVRMNPPDRWRPDEWPTYFVDLSLMDGLPVLALLLVGIVVVVLRLRRRPWAPADLLLLGSLLVPLAIYSVYSTGEVRMRHFSLALPWVMLAAAIGLDWLAARVGRWQVPALGCACAVLVALAVPRIVALDSAPSGMPQLLQFIGAEPVASTNGPVLSYFVGEDRTNARLREAFVNMPSDLSTLAGSYRLLVVDMQAELFQGELTDRYDQTTPELSVPNGNAAWYLADLLEHQGVSWGGWNDLLQTWSAHAAAASQLRVYPIRQLL